MIVGIYLSFHRPGALSVMQCLLHAIKPKSYVNSMYPVVKNDWPTYGIPEEIWVDNAPEFYSSHFTDACLQLGITPNHSPVGQAWFRATIERWFGTLNKRLLHELPGTTFSNIFHKKDYDPQKHAIISLEALLQIIHIWIVDYYHKRFHRGIQDIPCRRWAEGVVNDPPNLPPRIDELDILLGFIDHRRVSSSGIELFSLYYNSSELSLVRRWLEKGEKVTIKYDPTDISVIYVWDKHNSRFIHVPAIDQEYTRGLTLWQHQVIRRYALHFVKDHIDIVALCQAKKAIQKIVEDERLLRRRIGGKQKIAHYLNLGQPNYDKAVQFSASSNVEQSIQPELYDASPYLLPSESVLESIAIAAEGNRSITEDQEARPQTENAEIATGAINARDQNSALEDEEGWSDDYDLPTEVESSDEGRG